MSDLVVVVPSRGRPQAAHELHKAFVDTCATPTTLLFVIDDRDAAGIYEYPFAREGHVDTLTWRTPSVNMVQALNLAVADVLAAEPGLLLDGAPFAVGFMGDDHRPRTTGWDSAYLDVLHELGTGIVYGNDLLQRENLPTQVAMTSDIVRVLGFMAPPSLTHMYVDNFWLDLGRAAGCIRYLPDVVVEHMHPVAGKADWDAGHRRVNTALMFETDRTAYTRFRVDGSMAAAVAAVRTLR